MRRDEALAIAALPTTTGHLDGRCGLCGAASGFLYDAASPELREGLPCAHCHCNARQRAAAMLLCAAVRGNARVYATEQASPLFVALRRRLSGLRGSEYVPGLRRRVSLSLWLLRQGLRSWVRHRDVTALEFGDASLDAIVSLDVLEHVADAQRALREFARVLSPGGTLVLTVPFYDDRDASAVIATLRDDGSIAHIGEREFHGDPIRDRGVACFHHFAWDMLDAMRAAGFADAAVCRVQDARCGLPQGQWVLRAVR
ncbi:MAG: methyltransferase domain-containing protein [Luteimonas sp.]